VLGKVYISFRIVHLFNYIQLKIVNLTERIIQVEKVSESSVRKEVVYQHERDLRTVQTTVTQLREQAATLERLTLENAGTRDSGFGSKETSLLLSINLPTNFQIHELLLIAGSCSWHHFNGNVSFTILILSIFIPASHVKSI